MKKYQNIKNHLKRYGTRPFTLLNFSNYTQQIKKDFPKAEIHTKPEKTHYDTIIIMHSLLNFPEPEKTYKTFAEMGDNIICEAEQKGKFRDYLTKQNAAQINNWHPHDYPIYQTNKNEDTIKGTAQTGQGVAKRNIPTINPYLAFFDIELYPGTLNLTVEREIEFQDKIKIGSWNLAGLYINGSPAFAIDSPKFHTPPTFLEIVAKEKLRDKFNLKDGDTVHLSYNKDMIKENK